jgi:hypothetical protein
MPVVYMPSGSTQEPAIISSIQNIADIALSLGSYHVRASRSYIERNSSIVSLFKELAKIRIDA